MKILCNKSLFAIAAMATALISCSDEDAQKQPQSTEFSKTIEVFDDCGLNSIVLKLTSDDQSVVDMYSAENFQLIINPAPYDEPETDADVEDEEDADDIYSDDDAISVSISVMEKNFVEDVQDYELERTQPEGFKNLRAKWTKEYFPSSERGIKVTRNSINRRVYLTTKFGYAGQGTSNEEINNKWVYGHKVDVLIKNNAYDWDEACGYYYIAGIIRCKKQDRGKYSIQFYNPGPSCK